MLNGGVAEEFKVPVEKAGPIAFPNHATLRIVMYERFTREEIAGAREEVVPLTPQQVETAKERALRERAAQLGVTE
jgi:hypothetical protein